VSEFEFFVWCFHFSFSQLCDSEPGKQKMTFQFGKRPAGAAPAVTLQFRKRAKQPESDEIPVQVVAPAPVPAPAPVTVPAPVVVAAAPPVVAKKPVAVAPSEKVIPVKAPTVRLGCSFR
jgi:hypothetical protein